MESPEVPVTPETPNSPEKQKAEEHDYQMVSKANEEFNKGNYDSCLEALNQLEALNGPNSKLMHNRAVAEFYKSGCKDHVELLENLEKAHTNECGFSSLSTQLKSPGSPINAYNKAVIYYHRHMHQTAIDTLFPAIERLESLDEYSMALVGVLMLRLLLVTNQIRKALCFLDVMHRQLGIAANALIAEESSPQEVLPRLDERLGRSLKLLTLLTHILNRKVVAVPEDGSSEFAALKAHQYYIMKDFQMAAKQLKKINAESYADGVCGNELNTLIANNMGVIHLRVRHYAIAAKFFQNAIAFDKHIAGNLGNVELQYMSCAHSCEVLYNLGIAMLHLRRPQEAFQCFLVPLKSYHSNPRLWFRTAEACIMEHELKRLKEEKFKTQFGARTTITNRIHYKQSSQLAAVPEPTMPFAALSLRNALTLTQFYSKSLLTFPEQDESGEVEAEEPNWRNVRDNNFCNPSAPMTKGAINNLLSGIFAAYSYVSLRLGDYVTALEMAQELLKMENLSDAHKMLAHMYAGEALIMMDKLVEARPHLEPTFISTLNTFDFETKDWQIKSLDAAQSVVRYNLAVAMTMQGDFEMAKSLLNTCKHPIIAAKAFTLKIYLEKTPIIFP